MAIRGRRRIHATSPSRGLGVGSSMVARRFTPALAVGEVGVKQVRCDRPTWRFEYRGPIRPRLEGNSAPFCVRKSRDSGTSSLPTAASVDRLDAPLTERMLPAATGSGGVPCGRPGRISALPVILVPRTEILDRDPEAAVTVTVSPGPSGRSLVPTISVGVRALTGKLNQRIVIVSEKSSTPAARRPAPCLPRSPRYRRCPPPRRPSFGPRRLDRLP